MLLALTILVIILLAGGARLFVRRYNVEEEKRQFQEAIRLHELARRKNLNAQNRIERQTQGH